MPRRQSQKQSEKKVNTKFSTASTEELVRLTERLTNLTRLMEEAMIRGDYSQASIYADQYGDEIRLEKKKK